MPGALDGRLSSSTIDEAYRSHSRRVDELTEKVRWASRTWTWKPLMWGAFGCVVGGLVGGAVGAGMVISLVLDSDSLLGRFLLRVLS